MKVLRVYHAGRDEGHRRREAALLRAGVEVRLVVPSSWPDPGADRILSRQDLDVVELPIVRGGDVNRHRYTTPAELRALVTGMRPDIIDVHEEPFSVAARQWLDAAGDIPTVLYTAQNLDKRFPPPFAQFEARAYRQALGLYPCSRQAASVARGKGFSGHVAVLPLGVDPADFPVGEQRHDDEPFVIGFVGRLVPEKGLQDAVRVLAALRTERVCRLQVLGEGPDLRPALDLAKTLGVRAAVDVQGWGGTRATAAAYRKMHVLLVPSRTTATWVEQFGRVIVEAQASGCVVVAYDSGAIGEVCGDTGVLVPEGNVAALAGAVEELECDEGRWSKLRARGVHRSSDYTWDAVARGQVSLYEQVLEGPVPSRTHLRLGGRAAREEARREFGAPARTPVGERAIALPGFRTSRALNGAAGAVIDLGAEALERSGLGR